MLDVSEDFGKEFARMGGVGWLEGALVEYEGVLGDGGKVIIGSET